MRACAIYPLTTHWLLTQVDIYTSGKLKSVQRTSSKLARYLDAQDAQSQQRGESESNRPDRLSYALYKSGDFDLRVSDDPTDGGDTDGQEYVRYTRPPTTHTFMSLSHSYSSAKHLHYMLGILSSP